MTRRGMTDYTSRTNYYLLLHRLLYYLLLTKSVAKPKTMSIRYLLSLALFAAAGGGIFSMGTDQ